MDGSEARNLGLEPPRLLWYIYSMRDATIPTTGNPADTSEVAIFSRLLTNSKREMDASLARYILSLEFSEADQSRMQDLAEKNQCGRINPDERDELFSYVKGGHLLAILQSKARKTLSKKKR